MTTFILADFPSLCACNDPSNCHGRLDFTSAAQKLRKSKQWCSCIILLTRPKRVGLLVFWCSIRSRDLLTLFPGESYALKPVFCDMHTSTISAVGYVWIRLWHGVSVVTIVIEQSHMMLLRGEKRLKAAKTLKMSRSLQFMATLSRALGTRTVGNKVFQRAHCVAVRAARSGTELERQGVSFSSRFYLSLSYEQRWYNALTGKLWFQ